MNNNNLIKASGSIVVNSNAETVFNFFANPANDPLWRTEINQSILNGPLEKGVIVNEYSYLSKKAPNHLLQLTCVQFTANSTAIFETLNNAAFYLRSQRKINPVSGNSTEIIYQVAFDKSIVKFATGFYIPRFIISLKTKADLKKYLKQLKTRVEALNTE